MPVWRSNPHILIPAVGAAVALTIAAPSIWLILLLEGLLAPLTLVSAVGWGAWPAAWLGIGRREVGKQICVAAALGLGVLSVLTLGLGVFGILSRPSAWVILGGGFLAGAARLHIARQKGEQGARESGSRNHEGSSSSKTGAGPNRFVATLILLALAAPLCLTLFNACLPPGILWNGEANGYDVLEYHLQGPREYYETGRIAFLPHNVYTSFPQQMEMLYLLLMHLLDDPHAAGIPSQLLHAMCGGLTVIAVFYWSRPGLPRCLAALLAGSTPWLAYAGCLAYVENGMIFFTTTAAGLLIDTLTDSRAGRAAFAAGLCAGLAGGCKYTALVLAAVALAAAWGVAMRAPAIQRLKSITLFGLGVVLAFSPWLIKNAALADNPIYPFAYEWFGGKAWSADQAAQWAEAHGFHPNENPITSRVSVAARELFGRLSPDGWSPSLFGQVLFLFGIAGLLTGRSRQTIFLSIWLMLMLAGWCWLTFIPGRFVTPIIVPLALLGSHCLPGGAGSRVRPRRWLILLIALLGAGFNSFTLVQRLGRHNDYWQAQAGVGLGDLVGRTRIFVDENIIAADIPLDARLWIVGEAAVYYVDREIHYTVPFARDPWLAFAADAAPEQCLEWLREHGVTHVVFCWKEIERLRRTYGFAELVTPEWAAALEQAGLRRVATAYTPNGAPIVKYATPGSIEN